MNKSKNYNGLLIRNHANKMRDELNIQSIERKNYEPRILYPVKLFFKSERVIALVNKKKKKSRGSLSFCKKNEKFFREEKIVKGQKLRSMYRKEELWRKNK